MNSISYQSIKYGFRDIITCEKSNNSRISVMELKPQIIVPGYCMRYENDEQMTGLICMVFLFRYQIKVLEGLLF